MKLIIKLFIPIIISGIVLALVSVHPANATGNTIYFSPNNVPAPSTFPTYITINIMADTVGLSSSSGINGWNFVVTDNDPGQAKLIPINVSIAGNLLLSFGTPFETTNCVNAVGTSCDVNDGPGIVHTSAALQGPATATPVSGLIAKITYQALAAGPLNIGILSPCPGAPLNGCDVLTDGTPSPVPHTTLSATYGTPSTPDFRISAPNGTSPAPINVGGSGSAKINITSLTGQTGSISPVTFDTYPSSGLTFSCGAPNPAVLPPGLSSSVTCTYSSTSPAVYVVTLNVTIGSPAKSHLAPITISVGDFKATVNPLTLSFLKGGTGKGNVTVTSINGFNGNVLLTNKVTPATGLSVTGCPASLTVTPTTPGIAQCNFSSTLSNAYSVQFNATYTSGTTRLSRLNTMTVSIQDIKLTPTVTPLIFGANYTTAENVTVTSVRGFGGTTGSAVSLTTTANSTAITAQCNPTSITLKSGDVKNTLCTFNSPTPGHYNVNVTATSGSVVNMTTIRITVNPDFTISLGPAVTINPGATGNNNITITSFGFSGTVNFSVSASIPAGLTCQTPASVTLPPSQAKTTLSCTATLTNTFTLTVTATSGTLSHSAVATFTIAPDITVTGITVSTTTATVGDKIVANVGIKYIGGASNFVIVIKWGGIQVANKTFTAAAASTPTLNNYTVIWDTSGWSPDTRVISASVPPLPGEINTSDNSATGPSVTLKAAPGGILSGATLYAVIGGIVAAAAAAGAFVFLRRRRTTTAVPPAVKA